MSAEAKSKSSANLKQAVPFFMVTAIDRSLNFYTTGLGFEMKNSWTPHGKIEWCWLEREGVALMLQEYRPERQPKDALGVGVSICVMCADAIALYKELRSRGIQAKRPFVENRLWVIEVRDPDGYVLNFESPTDAPEETEYSE